MFNPLSNQDDIDKILGVITSIPPRKVGFMGKIGAFIIGDITQIGWMLIAASVIMFKYHLEFLLEDIVFLALQIVTTIGGVLFVFNGLSYGLKLNKCLKDGVKVKANITKIVSLPGVGYLHAKIIRFSVDYKGKKYRGLEIRNVEEGVNTGVVNCLLKESDDNSVVILSYFSFPSYYFYDKGVISVNFVAVTTRLIFPIVCFYMFFA